MKYDEAYMKTAETFAEMSEATRLKVGCIAVKDNQILSVGLNGTPTGWSSNICEENDKTKPEVVHAEQNMICKAASSTVSIRGATVYCTHAPCPECAKLLAQCGISALMYRYTYRDSFGLTLLQQCGIETHEI